MNIAILTGGLSTERAVAQRSGKNMSDWAMTAGHTVELFDLPEQIDVFLYRYKEFDLTIPVFHGRYGEDGVIT